MKKPMKSKGADITCGEMALSINLLKGVPHEWALLKRHKCEKVFGVQIAANHSQHMRKVCAVIEKEDIKVDFVDLNVGCPIDGVCSKGMGSALMCRPAKLVDIVSSGARELSCPVTVKMRTGWSPKTVNASELVLRLQRLDAELRARGGLRSTASGIA